MAMLTRGDSPIFQSKKPQKYSIHIIIMSLSKQHFSRLTPIVLPSRFPAGHISAESASGRSAPGLARFQTGKSPVRSASCLGKYAIYRCIYKYIYIIYIHRKTYIHICAYSMDPYIYNYTYTVTTFKYT